MERIECVVVGAGVVGLAVARALALAGLEVVVLEAAGSIGTGISSRNSEVIHAGMYYPRDSLKARLCVAGNRALYAYCAEHGIAHRRCGKLIIASDAGQVAALAELKQRGEANGVAGLQWLDAAQASALEPELRCAAALLSPATGIVDSHALMLALHGDAERAGALFAFRSALRSGEVGSGGIRLQLEDGSVWLAKRLINCAGLDATRVAAALRGLPAGCVPRTWYAKGNYFSCLAPARFSHLIYPIPEQAGLGVHLTLDLAGRPRFGPDVEWVDAPEYSVDPGRAAAFTGAIRRYWPGLPDGALQPDYAGVRPKLGPAGTPAQDFRIDDAAVHGVPGLVNLFGIESPGLTASLALADYVRRLAG